MNSPSRVRTYDLAVNSRPLYQLSYRGIAAKVTISQILVDLSSITCFFYNGKRLDNPSNLRYYTSFSSLNRSLIDVFNGYKVY